MSLVKDTLDIEALAYAFGALSEAQKDHDKARDAYDGYSWDYFGHRYIEAIERASTVFSEVLARSLTSALKKLLKLSGFFSIACLSVASSPV